MSNTGDENDEAVSDNGNRRSGSKYDDMLNCQIPKSREPEDLQSDMYRFWLLLTQYRFVILSLALLCTLLAAVYVWLAKPLYRAEVTLAHVQSDGPQSGLGALAGQFGSIASLVGLNVGGGTEREVAIAILRSRAFTEYAFEDYEFLHELFRDDWDQEEKKWKFSDARDYPTMSDAYRKFDEDVRRIQEDDTTGIIRLTIDWHDRELAAEWANLLVVRANGYLRQIAIDEANKNISYLNQELASSGMIELRQSISNLIEQQIQIAMIANTRKEFAFKVLDPAVAADEDDHIWPLRAVTVLFGAIVGGLIGIAYALISQALNPAHLRMGIRAAES